MTLGVKPLINYQILGLETCHYRLELCSSVDIRHSLLIVTSSEVSFVLICLYLFLIVMCLTFVEIRTFEVLLRTYEVKEMKVETGAVIGENHDEKENGGQRPSKRKHVSNEDDYAVSHDNNSSTAATSVVMARPCSEARGHTGYLTFARLQCLS